MLHKIFNIACCVLMMAFVVFSAPDAFAKKGGNKEKYDAAGKTFTPGTSKFCWRNSYTTGPGKKQNCGAGNESIGRFCYKNCPAGNKRFGKKCRSICPTGTTDSGGVCELTDLTYDNRPTYKGNKKGVRECLKNHGRCENNGAGKVFKLCKNGFKAAGKKCKPISQVDCKKTYGLKNGAGNSCKKNLLKADRVAKAGCNSSEEKSFGLCFKRCTKGDFRVGITCWKAAPKNWRKCGPLAYAKDTKACNAVRFDQAFSIGMMAFNIATMGAADAVDDAVDAAKAAENAAETGKWSKQFNDMQKSVTTWAKSNKDVQKAVKTWKDSEDYRKVASAVNTTKSAKATSDDAMTAHDYARAAGSMLSIVDPTGITGAVSSFSYSSCYQLYK